MDNATTENNTVNYFFPQEVYGFDNPLLLSICVLQNNIISLMVCDIMNSPNNFSIIMVGNIERAGIYSGLIKNKIDLSGVKKNIFREDFGIIHLPADYKKHLVVGEGIEV